MEKDFDGWNEVKKEAHIQRHTPFFHEREVWWAKVGVNVGSEQDGGRGFMRPVLVFKRFSRDVFWVFQ